jgi:hypothetical protein
MRSAFFRNQLWFPVANYSGVTIPPFSVVYNHQSAVGFNILGFQVKQPNESSLLFDREYFVTGPYRIADGTGAEGIACSLASPGFVRTNGGTPTKNQVWGPKHGQFTLEEHYYGFLCYGGTTTACGNTVSVFKQIGYSGLFGKVDDTNVTKGNSATVSVWTDNFGSDTNMNVSARNDAINLTSVNGKKCIIYAAGAYASFVMVECS